MFFRKSKNDSTNSDTTSSQAKDSANEILVEAIKKLKDRDIAGGRKLLSTYASSNLESPELFNLLGISYELTGDKINALKFYRIAYYLDQSFTPAVENLHRASYFYEKKASNINWGTDDGK